MAPPLSRRPPPQRRVPMSIPSWLRPLAAHLTPSRTRPTPLHRASRPRVEVLEDRAVPALDFGWALAVGTTANEAGRAVATDSAGDVYITGQFQGTVDFDPGPGTFNLVSGNADDAFV